MKKNIARKISCLYPGHIQLPLKKIYSSKDDGGQLEWYVLRHGNALNIIDFQNQLEDKDSKRRIKTDAQYVGDSKNTNYFRAVSQEDHKTIAAQIETVDPQKAHTINAKRLLFNSAFSELIIIQYFYNIDENDDLIIGIFNGEKYETIFKEIIEVYILAAQDYLLTPPTTSKYPHFYEALDLYFDIDVPQEEMRDVMMKKKDTYYDKFNHHFGIKEFAKSLKQSIKTDLETADNNIRLLLEFNGHEHDKFVSVLNKARRELEVNKNYRYALLEGFSFIEVFITQYLTDCKLKAGVSKVQIKKYEQEVNISYKLNIELQMFLQPTDEEKTVIGKINHIRSLRNRIMHGDDEERSPTKIDAQTAMDSLKAIYDLYSIINRKWKK